MLKKQRKQRQRILGKDQGGKKKLLYSPPKPSLEEIEAVTSDSNNGTPTVPEMEDNNMKMAEEQDGNG